MVRSYFHSLYIVLINSSPVIGQWMDFQPTHQLRWLSHSGDSRKEQNPVKTMSIYDVTPIVTIARDIRDIFEEFEFSPIFCYLSARLNSPPHHTDYRTLTHLSFSCSSHDCETADLWLFSKAGPRTLVQRRK